MTNTKAQATTKAQAFYGRAAKEIALLARESNPTKRAEYLAWAQNRLAHYTAKGASASKLARWAKAVSAIVSLGAGSAQPQPAITFTTVPAAKPKAVRKGRVAQRQPKSVDPLDALLAQTGMSAKDLMVALARRAA